MNLRRPFAAVTPTLDGPVLQALMTVEHSATGAEIHRRCRTGSAHGVRKVLHRLVEQGIVDEIDDGNAKYYRLDTRHLAYPAIAALWHLPDALAARIRDRLEVFDGLVHASLVALDPVTVLVVGRDQSLMDGPSWRYETGSLRKSIGEWTGERPVFEQLTAARLTALIMENDPRVGVWRANEMHLAGSSLFTMVQDARSR